MESGIISEGSVKGVLTGKHKNWSVFCHKILYEAMQRLRFDAFFDQLGEVKQELFVSFMEEMSNSKKSTTNTKTTFWSRQEDRGCSLFGVCTSKLQVKP